MRPIFCPLIASVLIVASVGGCLSEQELEAKWPPVNVVKEPKSGQWVVVNELIILATGQDIPSLIKVYKGEIVHFVKETDSYQVRFPVRNLNELNRIKEELRKRGIRAVYAIVRKPPSPGEPQ
jgi:hypothetical protein